MKAITLNSKNIIPFFKKMRKMMEKVPVLPKCDICNSEAVGMIYGNQYLCFKHAKEKLEVDKLL